MQIGVRCPRGQVSWDECLGSCVHDPLHPCDYTADMLSQVQVRVDDKDAEPGVESFTPTRLLGCPRQPVLMGQVDHYTDVEQAWPTVRGNMVHALMERAQFPGAVNVIREHRFQTTVMTKNGQQHFSAKPDLIVLKDFTPADSPDLYEDDFAVPLEVHVKIVDYKSTNDIDHDMTAAKLEHQLQVNMYAWVVSQQLAAYLGFPNPTEVVIDELEIVYVSMKKVRRFTSAGERLTKGKRKTYKPPTFEMLTLDAIKMWPVAKMEKYIARRIETYMDARETLPDILEGDDAWLCNYCPVANYCKEVGNAES